MKTYLAGFLFWAILGSYKTAHAQIYTGHLPGTATGQQFDPATQTWLPKPKVLRPLQTIVLEHILDYYDGGELQGEFEGPMGIGKGTIAAKVVEADQLKRPGAKYFFLEPTKTLVKQIYSEVIESTHFSTDDVGRYYSIIPPEKRKAELQKKIVVTTIHSFLDLFKKNEIPTQGEIFLFLDEEHMYKSELRSAVIQELAHKKIPGLEVRILTLSASPKGARFKSIYKITLQQAVDHRLIVPIKNIAYYLDRVDIAPAEVNGKYDEAKLNKIMEREKIVQLSEKIADLHLGLTNTNQLLINCTGIRQAELVAEIFGNRAIAIHGGNAIYKETPNREQIEEGIRYGQSPYQAIAVADALRVGFNAPNIGLILNLDPTMSVENMIQRMRNTRLSEWFSDKLALVIDFVYKHSGKTGQSQRLAIEYMKKAEVFAADGPDPFEKMRRQLTEVIGPQMEQLGFVPIYDEQELLTANQNFANFKNITSLKMFQQVILLHNKLYPAAEDQITNRASWTTVAQKYRYQKLSVLDELLGGTSKYVDIAYLAKTRSFTVNTKTNRTARGIREAFKKHNERFPGDPITEASYDQINIKYEYYSRKTLKFCGFPTVQDVLNEISGSSESNRRTLRSNQRVFEKRALEPGEGIPSANGDFAATLARISLPNASVGSVHTVLRSIKKDEIKMQQLLNLAIEQYRKAPRQVRGNRYAYQPLLLVMIDFFKINNPTRSAELAAKKAELDRESNGNAHYSWKNFCDKSPSFQAVIANQRVVKRILERERAEFGFTDWNEVDTDGQTLSQVIAKNYQGEVLKKLVVYFTAVELKWTALDEKDLQVVNTIQTEVTRKEGIKIWLKQLRQGAGYSRTDLINRDWNKLTLHEYTIEEVVRARMSRSPHPMYSLEEVLAVLKELGYTNPVRQNTTQSQVVLQDVQIKDQQNGTEKNSTFLWKEFCSLNRATLDQATGSAASQEKARKKLLEKYPSLDWNALDRDQQSLANAVLDEYKEYLGVFLKVYDFLPLLGFTHWDVHEGKTRILPHKILKVFAREKGDTILDAFEKLQQLGFTKWDTPDEMKRSLAHVILKNYQGEQRYALLIFLWQKAGFTQWNQVNQDLQTLAQMALETTNEADELVVLFKFLKRVGFTAWDTPNQKKRNLAQEILDRHKNQGEQKKLLYTLKEVGFTDWITVDEYRLERNGMRDFFRKELQKNRPAALAEPEWMAPTAKPLKSRNWSLLQSVLEHACDENLS